MRPVVAFLLLVSLGLAQTGFAQAPQGQAAEPPKKARIEGIVTSSTGEPVPRAQVRVQGQLVVQAGQAVPPASFAATADDAGKFVIPDIDPGRNYQLSAQRPGFLAGRYGARTPTGPGAPLVLDAGQVLTGLKITLTPQGVISGRVTDVNGDPVQGAIVALLRRGYNQNGRQLLPQNTSTTNDQGEFRSANLAPGRYYLMVQDRSAAQASLTGGPVTSQVNIATYYPNAEDVLGAAPLDVAPGQELRNMDIRLRQGRAFSIRGKATTFDGSAIPPGTTVLAPPENAASLGIVAQLALSQAQIRTDGSFELRNVRPGRYALQVVSRQNGPPLTGRMDVNVTDADLNGINLVLGPGLIVTGRMRLENGDLEKSLPKPNPGATAPAGLAVEAGLAGITVTGSRPSVMLVERSGGLNLNTRPAQLKEDGTFLVEGLAPSRYQLNLGALPQGMYVKSAVLNGADVTHSELDLTSGASGTLDLVLSDKATELTVNVRTAGDQSVAARTVSIWPKDPDLGTPSGGVRTTTTDQNGSGKFSNLPPGTYYAAAWEEIENGLQLSRDFLTLVTSEAYKLELREGSQASADLQMIPVSKIKAAEEKLP